MPEKNETADRLAAYSDAVFAVIVTIMVLELKAPEQASFSDLWPLWPTAISYGVSYLFIAIIWINHHYLMRFVGAPALGLIWINFVHLFMVRCYPLRPHGLRGPGSHRPLWCYTPGSSSALILPTTFSSARYWRARTPR
jgi:uncharacterized membrane protein